MAGKIEDKESLIVRIQQLENERDELRKDIEQLCFPQAGPGYLVAATRMHFQRTAGLEQEIENLKKKLAACTRDNQNLQEELSEVYHIKSQLADLHSAEVSKNVEAEKQLKFFQGCVASAFAERDSSLMEAVNAKEREETMSKKLNDLQKRVEELTVDCLEEKKLCTVAQFELTKLKEQNENFKKVIVKFYDIRQSFLRGIEECDLEEKCECLSQDAPEMWSFDNSGESSTSDYITVLEKELGTLKNSVDNLQNRLQMGLEIEDHIKKKVYELETDKILSYDLLKNRISELRHVHTQSRCEVMSLLEQERAQFKSMLGVLQERLGQLHVNRKPSLSSLQSYEKFDDIECRDVHIAIDTDHSLIPQNNAPSTLNTWTDEARAALAQALREKVATLLLLSQQEERYLLERNVDAALLEKMEELQRNLLQVTNEKVKALVELARLRQENQILQDGDKSILAHEREEGKLKNLLKKTYLSRWVGRQDLSGNETGGQGKASNRKSNYSVDIARMKVENATLKESIESLEHLTSSVHRLRLSVVKIKDSETSPGPATCAIETLNDIINEAKVVRTALGSSLPVSWSAEVETGSSGAIVVYDPSNSGGDTSNEKIDFVSASGLEMVELLILAAQFLKDNFSGKNSSGES